MTCIVGLVHEGAVYIAGDSVGVDGNWNRTPRADRKVFVRDGYAIGFTTSYRMGQVLEYKATLPELPFRFDRLGERLDWLMEFMVVEFVEAVRTAMKDAGYTKVENSREEGGSFMVGIHDRLFTVGSDFQVGEPALGFDAVGCGATYAIGAMAVMRGEPERRLRRAIQVAERFNAGVGGPVHVVRAP